jgi:hypothetical protein
MRLRASEIWQWMLARRACSGHGEQNNPTGQNRLPGLPQRNRTRCFYESTYEILLKIHHGGGKIIL